MLGRGIFFKAIIAVSSSQITRRFIYPFAFFKKKQNETQSIKPAVASKTQNTKTDIQRPNGVQTKGQMSPMAIKKLLTIIELKDHQYKTEQREKIREILKKINYSQLKQGKLENLEDVLSLYLIAKKDEIIKQEPKVEITMYESFLNIIDNSQFTNAFWKDASRVYRQISKLNIVNTSLHIRVPKIMMKALKKGQMWPYFERDLINILAGLTNREILLKDERTAIITIIQYFDTEYKNLNQKCVSSLICTLVKANIQSRFGMVLQAEENILHSFLHDLQAGKYEDLWEQKTYLLIEDNRYHADHKIMERIIQIVMRLTLELLNSNGQLGQSLTPADLLNILVNYSKKYSINKLSQSQKGKILQFMKRELAKEDTEKVQYSLALMLNYNFFPQHHALKLLIEHSKNLPMTARLAYELSRVGYIIDQKHFLPLQSLQSRNIKAEVENIIGSEQLLILVAARMQLEISLNSAYYNQVCGRYFSYLKANLRHSGYYQILSKILNMPPTAIYYLHSLFDMKSLMTQIEEREVSKIYGVRNRYLYLLIKYEVAGVAEQSKWYKSVHLDEFVHEILEIQLKIDPEMRQYSSSLLMFFNFYLQKVFKAENNYIKFLSVKMIMQYLLEMTRAFRQTHKISYQSSFFVLYWQIVNTFLTHISDVQSDLQWKIHFSQFLNILILAETPSHFFHTIQFKAFLAKLQQKVVKFKPHYELIADIFACGVNIGIIKEQNVFKETEVINIKRDLFGELKSITELWMMSNEEKSRHESMHDIIKFVNSVRVYSPSQVAQIKDEIHKYDANLLVRALQLFNMPFNETSSQLYLHLFNEMKNRNQIEQQNVDYTVVLSKIMKYLYGWTDIKEILNQILKRHFARFDGFTFEYHLDIISSIGRMGCFNRDYERRFMVAVLRGCFNPFTPVAAVTCLAKNGFGFNYKELRAIEEYIRSAKANWLEVFLLIQDQILPDLRKEIMTKIIHNQKVYPQNKISYNNGLVHKYLEKNYSEIYKNSHFATLKQDKSFIEKPQISLPISSNLRVVLQFLAIERKVKMEISTIFDNPCVVWKNLRILVVQKLSTIQIQMLKRLFSSVNDENGSSIVIGMSSSPQQAVKQIAQQLQLTLTADQQNQALRLMTSQHLK